MKVVDSVLDLVGSTPMIKLNRVAKDVEATVMAKVEFLNPSGSVKDRIAVSMIEAAEREGILKPDSIVVEATSGNTGIALATVAATIKGYRTIIVMPECVSEERKKIVRALGAELILTPTEEFVEGALKKVKELAESDPRVFVPQQFENPHNVAAHREGTGKEILEQTGGKVDAFVAGVGTGGTLMGVAEALKEVNPDILIVAVEPAESSALTSCGPFEQHKIEGIGDGFVPSLVKRELIDEVFTPTSDQACEMTRRLIREEGLLAGPSSGANVFGAVEIGKRLGKGKTVVTLLPDSLQRYLSTDLCENMKKFQECLSR